MRQPVALTLAEMQTAFRDVWASLGPLSDVRPMDWRKRRLSNIGTAVDSTDAVTLAQTKALILAAQTPSPATGGSGLGQQVVGTLIPDLTTRTIGTAARPWLSGFFSSTMNVPLLVGGSGTGSTLTLKTTSGVGATSAMIFHVGNNGATEAMRILNSGFVGFGITAPVAPIHAVGISNVAAVFRRDDTDTTAVGGNRTVGIENRDTTANNYVMLAFDTLNTTPARATAGTIKTVITARGAANVTGQLAVAVNNGSGLVEVLRFLDTGLINIPTAAALGLIDTNASHYLRLSCGSNITADRTLTLSPGDAARTITLSGNPTLSDWFDQSVKSGDAPTFSAANFTSFPTLVMQSANNKVAGAPVTDGYITCTVNGNSVRLMTTA